MIRCYKYAAPPELNIFAISLRYKYVASPKLIIKPDSKLRYNVINIPLL
jgi:hypothetical protein